MNKKIMSGSVLGLALFALGIGAAIAAHHEGEERIAHARAAAPAAVSDDATIVVDGEVVVEGTNGWTCMPDLMPDDNAPVCIDAVWAEMLGAVGAKAPYTASGIGLSYMLLGEPERTGVSNSDPYHEDARNAEDYTETGPHMMLIVPKALLEGLNSDPSTGGPYVMWGDTDYAHLMIPVD